MPKKTFSILQIAMGHASLRRSAPLLLFVFRVFLFVFLFFGPTTLFFLLRSFVPSRFFQPGLGKRAAARTVFFPGNGPPPSPPSLVNRTKPRQRNPSIPQLSHVIRAVPLIYLFSESFSFLAEPTPPPSPTPRYTPLSIDHQVSIFFEYLLGTLSPIPNVFSSL